MSIDAKQTRAVCEAAVTAPWTVRENNEGKGRHSYTVLDADGMWVAECDDAENDAKFIALARTALPEALNEIDRLRALLVEACDLAEEGWAYAGDYFRDKWNCADRLSQIRALAEGEGRK